MTFYDRTEELTAGRVSVDERAGPSHTGVTASSKSRTRVLGAEHTRRDVRVVLENGFLDGLADDLDEN